jgi:hypothetical protein
VTQSGFRRGFLRRVGPASRESVERTGFTGPCGTETRRTPGSAAGCNKPATSEAEEPIEVVKNHADGTGFRGWNPRNRRSGRPPFREWTLHLHVDGGATGTSRGTRASLCGQTQREGHLLARAFGTAPGRSASVRLARPTFGSTGRAISGTPRRPTGNGEGHGGGGETKPPATLVDRAIPSHRKMRGGHEPRTA